MDYTGFGIYSEPQALRTSEVREEILRSSVDPIQPARASQRGGNHSQIRIRGSNKASNNGRPSKLSEKVQSLELVFRNLTFSVVDKKETKRRKKAKKSGDGPAKKVILNNLDGIFRAGRLTAIMGPSGAGKTSLLDAIAGNLLGGQITGQVLVNGEDYTGKKIKEISGFVFQDDVLLATMTVKEAIEQSALLRLPKSVSREEREKRVEDLIALLNLQKCRNTRIGSSTKKGVSGGERKRTCTAMELIANPPMLFLDEPTSGLDTFTAYTVMKSLSRLTKRGRTVIATIHQPNSDIFHLFDDLLLLSGGNIIYYGEAKKSMDYFSRLGYPCPRYSNPADFYFMEVLREFEVEGLNEVRRELNPSLANRMEERERALTEARENASEASKGKSIGNMRIRELRAAWEASEERAGMMGAIENGNKDGVAVGTLRTRASSWTQFTYLLRRASKNALRDPLLISVQAFKAVFLGVLVGLVYLDSNQYNVYVQIRNKSGAIFFLALNSFFSSVFSVLTVFYVEKQVFFREYKAGYYTTTPYFLSKFLVELPYSFLFPYLMVLIAYYMVGLNPPFSSYLMMATFVAVSSIAGISLGVLIASIFDQLEVILAVTPIILLPLLLLSGIFVNSQTLPDFLNWIKYLSPVYYATVGMLQVEFSRDFPNCDPAGNVPCNGQFGLENLGLVDVLPMGVNLILNITLWVVLTIAAYVVLLLITRRRYRSA
ncbi:ABC-2 type transporter domain-containing protein [Paramicrosporidium saccamoebae]|uniref:ABC-2 type transporter domain-containing protein n=1 Tax=Paramicrosporidium saccamoebae TaxID=1246581 RepID=A0A2H9TI11_9FUNG|nr:ABC-2 type transporter domain-containing protein [Paramicrosporidium saccamoebae]